MGESARPALMGAFARFYREVSRTRHAAAQGRLAACLDAARGKDRSSPEALAARLRTHLAHALDGLERRWLVHATRDEREAFEIARYAMVALVDDLFIFDVDWPGARVWPRQPLEHAVFGTAIAGRRFYTLLDELIARRAFAAHHEELAAVFLTALHLGFQGQYRGASGQPARARYRERLADLAGAQPLEVRGLAACPQAYAHTLTQSADQRLAPVARWQRIGGLALAGYLVVTSAAWLLSIARLEGVLGT
jgi:type VI secretion system protein ImpK